METENTFFNRMEMEHCNLYYNRFGYEPHQEHQHQGYIKCKLIHAKWGTVIVADQIYLGEEATRWIQPLNFMPCVLARIDDHNMQAAFYIDISCGNKNSS